MTMGESAKTNSGTIHQEIHRFFGKGGILSKSLPRYEHRPEQIDMALAVADALEKGETLLLEAGTGVGKSLAYLVPIILDAARRGRKAFIATGTKTLQHQLIEKELPFLKKYLPVEFSYSLCLGADNYFCERRFKHAYVPDQAESDDRSRELDKIHEWRERSRRGLRSELDFNLSNQTWYQVCRIPELCSGQDCGHGGDCFYQRARRHIANADILVGNHHLLFANLRAEWEYLPRCGILVVDEAHNLDTIASECLGFEFSQRAFRRVWEGLRGRDGEGSLIASLFGLDIGTREALLRQVDEAETRLNETVRWFRDDILQEKQRVAVNKETAELGINHFYGSFSELASSLKLLSRKIDIEEISIECEGYAERLEKATREARSILEMEEDAPWLFWCEEIVPRTKSPIEASRTAGFRATPIEPGESLAKLLYPAFGSAVLVSATLSTGGDFTYARQRLGIGEKDPELSLPSPFNHRENLLVYAPSHLPAPSEFERFVEKAAQQTSALAQACRGGTFVLCTSYKMLDALFESFRDELSTEEWRPTKKVRRRGREDPILVMRQGDASRERLLEDFKKAKRAALFAASTFWQGVDVPGRALELVIITRLPFQTPDDPILEAKVERCRKAGGNPFYEIQVPYAVTLFRQGLGRLIRSHTDRGVIAILDSRVRTKPYGQAFLKSIPECEVTEDLDRAKSFLAGDRNARGGRDYAFSGEDSDAGS